MDRSVPQIAEQIVEARRIIPEEFVLQRAVVEDIQEVSPRGEKRKSISESGMMDDERSEHDACQAFASTCEASCETRGLVQEGRVQV